MFVQNFSENGGGSEGNVPSYSAGVGRTNKAKIEYKKEMRVIIKTMVITIEKNPRIDQCFDFEVAFMDSSY